MTCIVIGEVAKEWQKLLFSNVVQSTLNYLFCPWTKQKYEISGSFCNLNTNLYLSFGFCRHLSFLSKFCFNAYKPLGKIWEKFRMFWIFKKVIHSEKVKRTPPKDIAYIILQSPTWTRAREFDMLEEEAFGNRSWCCFLNWHASHMLVISFSVNVGSPITTPFDCMFWSFWRLMWSILLCHSFKSVSTF